MEKHPPFPPRQNEQHFSNHLFILLIASRIPSAMKCSAMW
ncbi:723_t:CDS:2 [Entrophospora sp. SA101]|nr:723_t:CDS:2 [Entrophospora sp. SA101]